jgi:hypothetical protein
MHVDEAGDDVHPGGVDHPRGGLVKERVSGDADDAVVPDRHVGAEALGTGAVEDGTPRDEEVVRFRLRPVRRRRRAGRGQREGRRRGEDASGHRSSPSARAAAGAMRVLLCPTPGTVSMRQLKSAPSSAARSRAVS